VIMRMERYLYIVVKWHINVHYEFDELGRTDENNGGGANTKMEYPYER